MSVRPCALLAPLQVPYFCHSHLLALITVGRTTSIPNPPAFDERLLPPNPMALDKILTHADIAAARQLVAQVLQYTPAPNKVHGCEKVHDISASMHAAPEVLVSTADGA